MKKSIEKAKNYVGKKLFTLLTLGSLALVASGCSETSNLRYDDDSQSTKYPRMNHGLEWQQMY